MTERLETIDISAEEAKYARSNETSEGPSLVTSRSSTQGIEMQMVPNSDTVTNTSIDLQPLIAIKSTDKVIALQMVKSNDGSIPIQPVKSITKTVQASSSALKNAALQGVRSIDSDKGSIDRSGDDSRGKTHTGSGGHHAFPLGVQHSVATDGDSGVQHTGTQLPTTTSISAASALSGDDGSVLTQFDIKIQHMKKVIDNVLESVGVMVVMTFMTLWALFAGDIQLATAAKSTDEFFDIMISIAFFLFAIEIVLASFAKPDYLYLPKQKNLPGETLYESILRRIQIGSFYFWLDFIATLSLILEMNWMGIDITGSSGGSKAGAASRTGARASRIIRIVRMVRLVRLVKLYKYSSQIAEQAKQDAKNKQREAELHSNSTNIETEAEKIRFKQQQDAIAAAEAAGKESRVGAAMSDLTNRRVIVLVLIMLIIIPLLSTTDDDVTSDVALQFVHTLAVYATIDQASFLDARNKAFQYALDNLHVLKFTIVNNGVLDPISVSYDDEIDLHRESEIYKVYLTNNTLATTLWIDKKSDAEASSAMGIYVTLFVVFLLIAGTIFFSSDVNRLVIVPIERMVDLVQKISANPLGVEYKMLGEEDGFYPGMETTTLLATITKIGRLMKVGFGEAGATVIARNMAGEGGKLRLLGGGHMITSIFGFCDVRQFTDTTECLQEEVMLFVNRIGHILHSIVVQCGGAANKNIGDAFLLTWKLEEKWNSKEKSAAADKALLCFCKSLIELGRYEEFICNFSVASTERLYKRFPGYNVRIGSGLHVGWAIEGAIGSHRKIDASYLSPHVNFTEYLESSTKQYGTPLLISEPFFKMLSPASAKFIRQVDRVRKSPESTPMGIYTYDSDLTIEWADPNRKLIAKRLIPALKMITAKFRRVSDAAIAASAQARMAITPEQIEEDNDKKRLKAEVESQLQKNEQRKHVTPTVVIKPYTEDVWRGDSDLVDLRQRVNEKFRTTFHQGIEFYIAGDWQKAKETFEHTKKLSLSSGAADGPSSFLLNYMAEYDYKAPANWKGYRRDYDGGH